MVKIELNALADPIVILALQALISLLGVAASFWVATNRGEMAATKYAQNETQRREHERILITNPLDQLKTSVLSINNVLINRFHYMDIHQSRSPDTEFFYEHLKTGYPELWQTIFRYENTYNSRVSQVELIYQNASDLLEKKWGDDPNFNIETHQLKNDIKRIIEAFYGEVVRRLIHDTELQLPSAHLEDPPRIIVGATHIMITSGIDIEKAVTDLNSILEGSVVFVKLQQLWKKYKSLSVNHSEIHYELDHMRALVHSGVHLKGWCTVGIAAKYEHARE